MRDIGANPDDEGTTFCVWAPHAEAVELHIRTTGGEEQTVPMRTAKDGFFDARVPRVTVGDHYAFSPDGRGPLPDPASRYQPEGVHGWSEIVDPAAYQWSDAGWRPPTLPELVLYEIHVGAFTLEGTLAAATMRLPELRDLGITAVQLMPIAEFAGDRSWGYDSASIFAPSHVYGKPDELRRFVDVAHRLGLAVILDVVYSHVAREGSYLAVFDPHFTLPDQATPWGPAVNLDAEGSSAVRAILRENALRWLDEYHVDGLRFDASHATGDTSVPSFLSELTGTMRSEHSDRRIFIIAEEPGDPARALRAVPRGGWGVDAVWSDTFYELMLHLVSRNGSDPGGEGRPSPASLLAGELVAIRSEHAPPHRVVSYLQNHERVGRPPRHGERIHRRIEAAAYRAATALLLLAPQIPLIFMGEEWGADSPFYYFAGGGPGSGEARNATSPAPDPYNIETYLASRLRWEERSRGEHAGLLRMHRRLLMLRKSERSLNGHSDAARRSVDVVEPDTIALRRECSPGLAILIVTRLAAEGEVVLSSDLARLALPATRWRKLFSSEDPFWCGDPRPPGVTESAESLRIQFSRPGALVLRASRAA